MFICLLPSSEGFAFGELPSPTNRSSKTKRPLQTKSLMDTTREGVALGLWSAATQGGGGSKGRSVAELLRGGFAVPLPGPLPLCLRLCLCGSHGTCRRPGGFVCH